MATNENGSRFPTFQWIAGILISIVLIIAGASLKETRGDIKDAQKDVAAVCDRVTILETANRLQFEEIRAWRKEVKEGIKEIYDKLDKHEKSTQLVRKWNDVK